MIKTVAIIWAVLHFLPWAIIGIRENQAILILGAIPLAILVGMTVMAFPPIGIAYIFTAIYCWRTLVVYKD